jgi:hypothetical protein
LNVESNFVLYRPFVRTYISEVCVFYANPDGFSFFYPVTLDEKIGNIV